MPRYFEDFQTDFELMPVPGDSEHHRGWSVEQSTVEGWGWQYMESQPRCISPHKPNQLVASVSVAVPDVLSSLGQIGIALVTRNVVIDLAMLSFPHPSERRIIGKLHPCAVDKTIHSRSCLRVMLILLLSDIIQHEEMWAIWTSCRTEHIGSLY